MTNEELMKQHERCEQWNDADQWDALARMYYAKGYYLNALNCFRRADDVRGCAFAEAMPAEIEFQP